MRFKETHQVYNTAMACEAASVDIEIAARYLEVLVMIINKGGCTKEMISPEQNSLYEKKMPSRIS